MVREPSNQQAKCLKKRGFEVVIGHPKPNEQFPYISLGAFLGQYHGIYYHHNNIGATTTARVFNPTNASEDKLISLIENNLHFYLK